MNTMKKTLGQRGFTLLEVMIALSIFSIGILAVVAMQANAIRGNTAAQQLSNATAIAQERMERIMEQSFATFPAAAAATTTVGMYTVTETFTNPPGISAFLPADARWVDINVTWTGALGRVHNVPVSFIKTQNLENSYVP